MRIRAAASGGMPLWLIPMVYTAASVTGGLILPRLERAYLAAYTHDMSVGSALAYFSAVSSGMMALTGIVFAIAFVVVQFSALAYSPRLAVMFAGSSMLFHTLGIFFATFTYSLAALAWTDRGRSGTVPLFSTLLVGALLIISMFAFARLIQSLSDLQIHNVLQAIGARGRSVIRSMFPYLAEGAEVVPEDTTGADLAPATQMLVYSGEPRVIASVDYDALARLARSVGAVVAMECAVGDTQVEDAVLLRVHGAAGKLPEAALMRAIRLASTRTFEQDPKFAIRLLVDIAIKALSPAVNDPTTAVQAIDQIEDLLRRLGRRRLDAGLVRDAAGALRVTFPVPTWQDYLALSFDEIRLYGIGSLQIDRRLRAALLGLAETITVEERRAAVRRYLDHLDLDIGHSVLDEQDRAAALQQDRQGLGLSRHPLSRGGGHQLRP
jgi:uncharacterized membrane protein